MRIAPVLFNKIQFTPKTSFAQIKPNSLTPLQNDVFFKGIPHKLEDVELTDKQTGEKVKAVLVEEYSGEDIYHEILLNNYIVGFASAKIIRPKKTCIRTLPERYLKNGVLYIRRMDNFKQGKYKDVGRILHKSMFEKSKKLGFNGRVALSAAPNSHCFHTKCGFVPTPAYADCKKVIEEALQDGKGKDIKPSTEQLGIVEMYLPAKNARALYGNF